MLEIICDSTTTYESISNKIIANKDCWVCVDLNHQGLMNIIKELINQKFKNPYITKRTPKGVHTSPSLSLTYYKNGNDGNQCIQATENQVRYVLEQFKNGEYCSIYLQFDNETISKLKSIPIEYDKEIGGILDISNTIVINEKIIHIIHISKLESGKHDTISLNASRYNFHSHPEKAYITYDVKNAWPSCQDYISYIAMGKDVIFHCVTAIEGIYILSLTSFWSNNISHIKEDFLRQHLDVNKNSFTPEQYVEYVNNIKLKNLPVFKIIFLNWENINRIFKIEYSKHGINCFHNDEIKNHHNELHT